METPLLTTKQNIRLHRQISKSVNDDLINPFILDAQFIDVQDLLGADFYNDLLRNYTDTKYKTLLEGGAYTYGSTTYTNVGLETVLVFFSYARYVKFGSFIDTAFSYVEKTNDQSTPVSENSKQIIYKANQQIAHKYWQNVKAFLNRNSSDYTLWDSECRQQETTFKISKII